MGGIYHTLEKGSSITLEEFSLFSEFHIHMIVETTSLSIRHGKICLIKHSAVNINLKNEKRASYGYLLSIRIDDIFLSLLI